ncbi:hypothetical protein F5878DRAFT_647029 [Lentinula raphanica]|uniref:Myb/SANT-like domain-containing protein n=1 Tax=Lentinula raphanica TaxID=153919 RepID=A0AA38U4C5_9AGAR|nr:hypothetical protein F5878DRAFT_647029 [Lentinula raphanica]
MAASAPSGPAPVSNAVVLTSETPDLGAQCVWTQQVDDSITNYLDQVKKEQNRTRNVFPAAVWTSLGQHLVALGHQSYTNEQLRDRLRFIMKHNRSLSHTTVIPAAPVPDSSLSSTQTDIIPLSTFTSSAVSASPMLSVPDCAAWNFSSEAALIAFLVKSKEDGLMSENNFKNKVYTQAATHLVTLGFNFKSAQVKSRWTHFKAEFKIVAKLRTLSGFGWDHARRMVIATDQVWEAYLQGHSKARPFRKSPFPHYDDIAAMVRYSAATAQNLQHEDSESSGDNDEEDKSDSDSPEPNPKASKKRHAIPPVTPARKRVRTSASAQALESMSSAVTTLTDGLASGSLLALPSTDSPAKKREAFDVVRAEEGLSPYSLAKARRVFRGSGELAWEYLSFDFTKEAEISARHLWLVDEMERV